jgi:F420-dependent methylenetetrahydromethanopterin dehydrogenase
VAVDISAAVVIDGIRVLEAVVVAVVISVGETRVVVCTSPRPSLPAPKSFAEVFDDEVVNR